MTDRLSLLQVSTADRLGGAERVAWNLFEAYRSRGYQSRLVVGRRRTDDPDVGELRHDLAVTGWRRFWWGRYRDLQPYYGRFPGSKGLCRWCHRLASPEGLADRRRGIEDFNYPGARRLIVEFPKADLIHCHNLHGSYFDLRCLPRLCRRFPVVLTLHDAWLLAGHCAHSFDCERWKSGCGQCPDLSIYPSIQRDGTRENWRRKRDIFERCRLFASTPCQWLMDKVEQSMLRPAIIESRVIPNGVDQTVFRPGDRRSARQQLGIDPAAFVLLFSALGLRTNPFKDCTLLLCAIKALASKDLHQEVLFLALGQAGPSPQIGRATVRFVPPVDDPRVAAVYYQASDVYVHAARADTFPTSILEALSCGIPVAATAVGGICEQVKAWPADDATGVLTPQGDALALAEAIARLLLVNDVRARMGDNAFQDAGRRFNLDRQVEAYLNWYRAIISRSSCGAGTLNRSRAGKSRIRPNAWVIPAAASP